MERMRNKHTDGFMIEAWKNLINEKNILHCYLIDRKVHKTEILVALKVKPGFALYYNTKNLESINEQK